MTQLIATLMALGALILFCLLTFAVGLIVALCGGGKDECNNCNCGIADKHSKEQPCGECSPSEKN